jgi:hypothetical protein
LAGLACSTNCRLAPYWPQHEKFGDAISDDTFSGDSDLDSFPEVEGGVPNLPRGRLIDRAPGNTGKWITELVSCVSLFPY